jgi:hypothetical protein
MGHGKRANWRLAEIRQDKPDLEQGAFTRISSRNGIRRGVLGLIACAFYDP